MIKVSVLYPRKDGGRFAAAGHLLFENVGAFPAAMAAHGAEFRGDIPNFTDIEPTIQVSDVKM